MAKDGNGEFRGATKANIQNLREDIHELKQQISRLDDKVIRIDKNLIALDIRTGLIGGGAATLVIIIVQILVPFFVSRVMGG